MMLSGLLFFVFFAIFAMLWLESFWSNAITLINVIIASLIAMSFFEPLATAIDGALPSYTYLWDFLSLWLIFTIAFGVLRIFTDMASRTRVKFKPLVEMPGRIVCGMLVGLWMVAFTATTIHTAAIPSAPFFGSIGTHPDDATFFVLRPDVTFLNLVQGASRGSLAASPASNAESSPYPEDAGRNVFDPHGDFVYKYRQRRRNLEQGTTLRVDR
jgi:hypothetical protein